MRLRPGGGAGRSRRAGRSHRGDVRQSHERSGDGRAGAPGGLAVRSQGGRAGLSRSVHAHGRRLEGRVIKRAFDCLLAGTGLVVSAPLWALVALAIKLEDRGAVLYRQERVGKGGRSFNALTFRSMVPDPEPPTGPAQPTP